MFQTLKTNWRDIVLFLLIGIGFAILADFLVYWASRTGNSLGVASLLNYLQGFSRFVGANLAAALLGVIVWPTLNRFGNQKFSHAWQTLPPGDQLKVYVSVLLLQGIMAAICFAA
jgi:ABC-type siderophore export system fused ATPase/permease subunit